MNIQGKITGISYRVQQLPKLEKFSNKNLDINTAPTTFLLDYNNNPYAISKWVSPKRTRSYPYQRVYDTLSFAKRITIIPIIKDEGAVGDRDFIQWDTISLMSLLDVYIIFAYYDQATARNNKITQQKFNNIYIKTKLKDIRNYHSSALHWNLNEVVQNFHKIIDLALASYSDIESVTGIKLHNKDGIIRFKERIGKDTSQFMDFSRSKSIQAQSREIQTNQPKEVLISNSKSKITIYNYLGGEYYLTVDETLIENNTLHIIESKHSKSNLLPSLSDIKDGLLKMILFSNLVDVTLNDNTIQTIAELRLTSPKIQGSIDSLSDTNFKEDFFKKNNLSQKQITAINLLFLEANENNFKISIRSAK